MSPWARAAALATILASVLAADGAQAAPAIDVYADRTAMAAADARCRLFEPQLSAALRAGQAQARNAALRSGAQAADLDRIAGRARASAAAASCSSPALAASAARVRSAFQGYGRVRRMSFPGETAGWEATRLPAGAAGWRLTQTAPMPGGRVVFGIAGPGAPALTAVSDFGTGPQPYGARLVLRDADRTSGPYLDVRAGRLPALPRRTPPRAAARVYQASGREPAGPELSSAGGRTALAFRFPAAAAEAIDGLDPREAVAVEFLFGGRTGETVRTAYVEVGDFAAGRAFLSAAPRQD